MPYLQDLEDELEPVEDEPRPFVGPRLPRRPFDPASIPARPLPVQQMPPEMPDSPMPVENEPSPEFLRIIGKNQRASDLAPNPRVTDYERDSAAEAKIKGERPAEPKPKWWQRVAAGAVGGLAGGVNAGGRTRIDPSGAVDTIYGGPEYRRKLSDWMGRVEGAEAKTKATKGTLDEWMRNRQAERQEELAEAQIDQSRSQAEYNRHRAAMEMDQWAVDGRGRIYNKQTGEIKNPAPTAKERFDEATALGATEEQARFYSLNGKMPEPKAEPQQIPGRDVPLPPEVEAQRKRMVQARPSPGTPGGTEADDIAQAIVDGKQPPDMKGLYRFGGPVRAKLAKAGYDLTTATKDWQAVTRHLSTLNGPQQERLRQAVNFTYDSLDQIEQLYDEWSQAAGISGIKILNRGNLAVSKQIGGKAGEVATNLEAQINDLTSELGTVYKGGNSSTDESLRLAGENLKADWNEQTFKRALEQIRKNLQIRRNSINNSQPAGVSENSQYVQKPAGGRGGTGSTPKADPLGIR